jgi:hypothetical protein
MAEQTRVTLDAFIAEHGIMMTAEPADSNPNTEPGDWARDAHHWICVFKKPGDGRRSMRVPFSQGSAHTEPPTAAEVLNCLALDASGYANAQSFEDWCVEYGYDTDSRKAERTYKAVERQADKLARFAGVGVSASRFGSVDFTRKTKGLNDHGK